MPVAAIVVLLAILAGGDPTPLGTCDNADGSSSLGEAGVC